MAENTSQRNTPRTQRNVGNNRALGMVITKLKPLSSVFYLHFHEKNRARLRQFNAISNAIYNIFRLVEADPTTGTKVNKWLSGIYTDLSGNVNTYKVQIDKSLSKIPVQDSSFDGYNYEEFEIRWNHPLTYKLLDIISTINVMTRQAHQLWLFGEITQQVHDRIVLQLLSSLQAAMDSITKILDAENRVDGKYDALPFIKNIKRFKSVELYITSLETKATDNPSSEAITKGPETELPDNQINSGVDASKAAVKTEQTETASVSPEKAAGKTGPSVAPVPAQ
ncbi:hypothetical protein [Klebsiella grimontii]|uniref:hypothetical protein n=1 Tax=Klebsiella grimontii TaxID=2058152 RepID=UPI0012B8AE75|nr:hypothetical protein [Klebsiella grimontii]